MAVPAEIAVTLPLPSTLATELLLDDQVTFLLLALVGEIVATKVSLLSSTKLREVLSSEMPITGIVADRPSMIRIVCDEKTYIPFDVPSPNSTRRSNSFTAPNS